MSVLIGVEAMNKGAKHKNYFVFYSEESLLAVLNNNNPIESSWDYECYCKILDDIYLSEAFNDVYQMKLNKGNRDISFDSLNSTDDFDSLVDYKEYLRNSDNIILFIKEDTEETEFLIKQLKYGINELNLPVIIVYLDFDIDIDDDCGFISGKREKIKNTIKHFNTSFQILHCAITFEMPFDKKAFWLVLNYLDLNKHISKHTHLSQSKRRLIDLILENILLS